MTARAITKTLGGKWCGHYGLCRCPAHDDRNPSLKIKDDPTNRDGINLICFAGCDWKDVKAALRQQGLIVMGTTHANVSGRKLCLSPKRFPIGNHVSSDDDEKRRAEYALKLWAQSVPLPNTLGWRYFTERRELHIGTLDDLSHVLRWHEVDDAAVIALMTDPISNEPIGIHRTFLNPDGYQARAQDAWQGWRHSPLTR